MSSWCKIGWKWKVEDGERFLDGSAVIGARVESRDLTLDGCYKAEVTLICHMPSN